MLMIKLRRIGRRNQPSFRLAVTEKRAKLRGRFIADLGWFNPVAHKFEIDGEQAKRWLKDGAQPTPTVKNLLIKAGIISGPKSKIRIRTKKTPKEAPAEVPHSSKIA